MPQKKLCCYCLSTCDQTNQKVFYSLWTSFSFSSPLIFPIGCPFFYLSFLRPLPYPRSLIVSLYLPSSLPIISFYNLHYLSPFSTISSPCACVAYPLFPSFTLNLRLSQFQMSWLLSCWVTRQTSALWSPWSLGDASFTDP